jgi:transcriptional regulator with XRE-family HTH domain
MRKNGKLKLAIFEEGISQIKLSLATGIPRSYISLAINGKFNLEIKQKSAICKALSREYDDLFTEYEREREGCPAGDLKIRQTTKLEG